MKTVIILSVLLLTLGLAAFYMGWFNYATDNGDNDSTISVTIDKDAFDSDKDKMVNEAKKIGESMSDSVDSTQEKMSD